MCSGPLGLAPAASWTLRICCFLVSNHWGLSHTCIDFTWNLRDFEVDQGKRYVHEVAVVHSGFTWVFLEGLCVGKVPSSMHCPEAMPWGSLLRQGGELLERGI